MHQINHSEVMRLVGNMPGSGTKKDLVTHLIHIGEVTEEEAMRVMDEDIRTNVLQYAVLFRTDDLTRILYNRLAGYPMYLARALVRAKPEVFYAYGFTFRLLLTLKANLGPVILNPAAPSADPESAVYLESLPQSIQIDLKRIETECKFREWLYYFSRDTATAFELLEEAIENAPSSHDKSILAEIRTIATTLDAMRFPDCVTELNGNPFPSFHVRWWLERTKQESRVLNIGDTGSHKTAYAALAVAGSGCRRVLVLSTANARQQWGSEVEKYFRESTRLVSVVEDVHGLVSALDAERRFTVVAYSTLIRPNVIDVLIQTPFDGIIWDECQYGKNVSGISPAQRAALSARLFQELNPKRIVALSATPWINHPKEFGAAASVLRPQLFPTAKKFRDARMEHARLLREFFDTQVVDIELREIVDLPKITPKPWEDLFGAEFVELTPWHRELYERVREDDTALLTPAVKCQRLLLATTHPHLLRDQYEWEDGWEERFSSEFLSTKLLWLRENITDAIERGEKVVVASGIYATGITRPSRKNDIPWVGGFLQEWFGMDRVRCLDGEVSLSRTSTGSSDREQMIRQWRYEPETMLLASIKSCPDSVNLTVQGLPGVTGIALFPISFGWEPWKQFLGRFLRPGQELPVRFRAPILQRTIDESLYHLLQRKWEVLQLFRAQVPLSEAELDLFDPQANRRLLALQSRSAIERINVISAMARGRGERGASVVLADEYEPGVSNGLCYARSFLDVEEGSTSQRIACAMALAIRRFDASGLINAQGILDAGCGSLTMERALDAPVFGIDMNPHMMEAARPLSRFAGANARVGCLSDMPHEWENKFELVICSLVLDWTSLRKYHHDIPERLAILNSLIRVTHPFGRIWITTTYQQMREGLLASWVRALEGAGCAIIQDLTGLIRTRLVSDEKRMFRFWSLCFSPGASSIPLASDVECFRFAFEESREKVIRGRRDREAVRTPVGRTAIMGDSFEIVDLSGVVRELNDAAKAASEQEVQRIAAHAVPDSAWRFHRVPEHLGWRVLEELHHRGLLDLGTGPIVVKGE